jgi:putative membrane protein
MLKRTLIISVAVAVLVLLCSVSVVGQDQKFAIKAAKGGTMEVELGRLATIKAHDAAVKSFGRRMITDHTESGNKLKELAKRKGMRLSAVMDAAQHAEMKRLSKLRGVQFDRAYMEMMVADHEKDVSEFEKQANSGNDRDFKAFAAEVLPTLKLHLELARETAAKLK